MATYGSGSYGGGTYGAGADVTPPAAATGAYPTYTVEVAWSTTLTGAFVVGTSTIGGAAVIPGRFGPAARTFVDETARVKSLSGSRGRDAALGAMAEGRCTITLQDTTGRYNPTNTTSPLYGTVAPGRPVRVSATYAGRRYGLFAGVIESLESHPRRDEQEAVITCVDLFEWLGVAYPVIAATGPIGSGAAIGLVLDAIEWTADNGRRLDAGTTLPDFSADGTVSGLQLIENLLTVDMGAFFIAGDGTATYRSRASRWQPEQYAWPLDGTTLSDLRPRVALEQVKNRARVTRTPGGALQEANEINSQNAFGIRDHPAISSAYLNSDAQAANLAAFLVALQANPRDPARQVTVPNRTAAALTQQLARELGDRVTVAESVAGTSFTGIVEGIAWEAGGGGRFHTTHFLVSKLPFTFFVIGLGTIGGTAVVGY